MTNIFEKPGSPLNVGALNLGSQHGTAATVVVDANSTVITLDSTNNAIALDLPAASDNPGRTLFIVLTTDPNAHNATITPAGSDTVGGSSTKALTAAAKFAMLTAVGTDWNVILAN